MKLSTRYGLVGIGALGVLSLVHWGRGFQHLVPVIAIYLMGIFPNLLAAIAIPFILLSIWEDQKPAATYQVASRRFVVLTLVAGFGLIAWEFLQQSSRSLYFDFHDIGATFFGIIATWVLFVLLTPRGNAKAFDRP